MTPTRQPFFTVSTPYEKVPLVVCYQDTWMSHISINGRATPENHRFAMTALAEPTVILPANGGYVMFVNELQRSSGSGSPFAVIVDPSGDPTAAVASIGHRRELIGKIDRSTALWLPRS